MTVTPGQFLAFVFLAALVAGAFEAGWWLGRREAEREHTAALRRLLEQVGGR